MQRRSATATLGDRGPAARRGHRQRPADRRGRRRAARPSRRRGGDDPVHRPAARAAHLHRHAAGPAGDAEDGQHRLPLRPLLHRLRALRAQGPPGRGASPARPRASSSPPWRCSAPGSRWLFASPAERHPRLRPQAQLHRLGGADDPARPRPPARAAAAGERRPGDAARTPPGSAAGCSGRRSSPSRSPAGVALGLLGLSLASPGSKRTPSLRLAALPETNGH